MQAASFCPTADAANYRQILEHTRQWAAGFTSSLPVPLHVATLFGEDPGSTASLGLARMLVLPHDLAFTVSSEPIEPLLEQAVAARGQAQLELLERAWRACPAPELAAPILALSSGLKSKPLKLKGSIAAQHTQWASEAPTAPPAGLFATPWPTRWRDALRRVVVLYDRPASPALAAAALDFALQEPKVYTSIASQAFWQALAWFIAAQGDLSVLERLRTFEKGLADWVGRTETPATDALAARSPAPLPVEAAAILERLPASAPAPAPSRRKLKLADPEERLVAADALLAEQDPRGEFILLQSRIADGDGTVELLAREQELLKKHGWSWVPVGVDPYSCIFRRGVVVSGAVSVRSDRELRALRGAAHLQTLEEFRVYSSMGRLKPPEDPRRPRCGSGRSGPPGLDPAGHPPLASVMAQQGLAAGLDDHRCVGRRDLEPAPRVDGADRGPHDRPGGPPQRARRGRRALGAARPRRRDHRGAAAGCDGGGATLRAAGAARSAAHAGEWGFRPGPGGLVGAATHGARLSVTGRW